MTARVRSLPPKGNAKPRLAPPTPARSGLKEFRQTAADMGIVLMPWQEEAARYLTAMGSNGRHLYREVCIVVARQNGKTTLMQPFIIAALRDGKKVLHIANQRELPREMFGIVASTLEPELFLKRRGKGGKMQTIWPRFGSGQEEIVLANEGSYRIAAAGRGGARGKHSDIVIIDELREMETDEVIGAAEPTLTMSEDPQLIYLSNMGSEKSVVLNAVRERAGKDDSLAYLEWSADPDRTAADYTGWLEANPAMGHYPQVDRAIEAAYRRHMAEGTMAIFETERLCRSVLSMAPEIFSEAQWLACQAELEKPLRPTMGIAMHPSGTRASAVIAWQQRDETIGLSVIADVTGEPIAVNAFGEDLRQAALKAGVSAVGYDSLTDAALAKFFKGAKPIVDREYANATARLSIAVAEQKIRWNHADEITADRPWVHRRPYEGSSGAYRAVPVKEERPATAVLAAIRAVYLASGPKTGLPKGM